MLPARDESESESEAERFCAFGGGGEGARDLSRMDRTRCNEWIHARSRDKARPHFDRDNTIARGAREGEGEGEGDPPRRVTAQESRID